LADVEPAVSEDCAAKADPAISVVATSAMANFLNIGSSCLFDGGDVEIAPFSNVRLNPTR
jgi:hypothetical protein